MKHLVQHFPFRMRGLFNGLQQAATDRSEAQRVQALLDELEDAPPNSLLVNLATGFPSALLCVLAAGALAGALAGHQVGAGRATRVAPNDGVAEVVALRQSAAQAVTPAAASTAAPTATATTANRSTVQGAQGALSGRQAHLDRLEQTALFAAPDLR